MYDLLYDIVSHFEVATFARKTKWDIKSSKQTNKQILSGVWRKAVLRNIGRELKARSAMLSSAVATDAQCKECLFVLYFSLLL